MFCPQVGRLAHQLAVESEHVVADVLEVETVPELRERYRVTGVPKTIVNDRVELLGSQSESTLLDAIESSRL